MATFEDPVPTAAASDKPTAVAPAKKAASQKKRGSPTHPPYFEMIKDAIVTLKDRTGSSQYAITKFIEDKQKILPSSFRKVLLLQLKKFVANEKLVKVKNSYKLPSARPAKPADKSAPAKKKPASIAKPKAAKAAAVVKAKPAAKAKAKAKAATPVKAKAKAKAATPVKAKAGTKRKAPEKADAEKKPAAKARRVAAAPAKKVPVKKAAAKSVKPKSIKSPAKKAAAKKGKK